MADRKLYLLGGRNTTDLFLGDYSSHRNIDRELLPYETEENPNSSLKQVRAYFESVWKLEDCRPYICRRETEDIRSCKEELRERYGKRCKEIRPIAVQGQKAEHILTEKIMSPER